MNPVILYKNVFEGGTLSATDTDSNSKYDILNVIDWRSSTHWLANSAGTKYLTCDLNKQINAGFETGDFTGWTNESASLVNGAGDANGGSYGCKLVAAASTPTGATSDAMDIDPAKTYTLKYALKVEGYSSGTYAIRVMFYDSEDNYISQTESTSLLANTAWTSYNKTVGPAGDVVPPAHTASIKIRQKWIVSGTGNAWVDDVLFYEQIAVDSFSNVDHNLFTAGATVGFEYADSSIEDVDDAGWTSAVSFSPSDNKTFIKTFTEQTVRAWRQKIVTASIIPYVAVVMGGSRMLLPYPPEPPFDPYNEGIEGGMIKSNTAADLGAAIRFHPVELMCPIKYPTRTWAMNTLKPFWDTHGRKLKRYIYAPDLDNLPSIVYWAKFKDKSRFRMPLTISPYVDLVELEMEAVAEE